MIVHCVLIYLTTFATNTNQNVFFGIHYLRFFLKFVMCFFFRILIEWRFYISIIEIWLTYNFCFIYLNITKTISFLRPFNETKRIFDKPSFQLPGCLYVMYFLLRLEIINYSISACNLVSVLLSFTKKMYNSFTVCTAGYLEERAWMKTINWNG